MTLSVFGASLIDHQAPLPRFEVASVKPAASSGTHRSRGAVESSVDPGQFRMAGPLKALIIRAYGVRNYQLSGPSWLWSDEYEVIAKLPDGSREDQIPQMLQTLLAERFGMKIHWEAKEQRVYALVVGKNGPRLKASKESADRPSGLSFTTKGHLVFKATTLASFSEGMSNFLDRPLVDRTGLSGRYNITLDISMEDLAGIRSLLSGAEANVDSSTSSKGGNEPASLCTALQDLGLKLESARAPVRRLVIDEVHRIPTGN